MMSEMMKKIMAVKIQKKVRFIDDITIPEEFETAYIKADGPNIKEEFEVELLDKKKVISNLVEKISENTDKIRNNGKYVVVVKNKKEDNEDGAYIEFKYYFKGSEVLNMIKK